MKGKVTAILCAMVMIMTPFSAMAESMPAECDESVQSESVFDTDENTADTEISEETEEKEAHEIPDSQTIDTEETMIETEIPTTDSADSENEDKMDDPQYWKELRKQYSVSLMSAVDTTYEHNPHYANYKVHYGVDISSYQEDIDWAAAKADGVEFAIIRAAYRGWGQSGRLVKDGYTAKNIEEAQAQGIKVGVYIYSQAITEQEAKEEVDFVHNLVQEYKLDLPLVMDFEYAYVNDGEGGRLYDANLSKAEATNVCMAFCNHAAELGYTPMVYANKSTLTNDLNASVISEKYPIWLAHYTKKTSYTGDYDYWQYSESISVDGISGPVDGDFWYEPQKDKPNVTTKDLAQPELLSVNVKDMHENVITWGAVDKAEWYMVYRRTNTKDTWHYIGPSYSTSYNDKKTEPGQTYNYTVRAIRETEDTRYRSSYDKNGITGGYVLSKPKITESSGAAKKNTITWKKVAKAEKYYVYRKVKDGKYSRIGSTTKTTYTDTKCAYGDQYIYTVRAAVYDEKCSKWVLSGYTDGPLVTAILKMPVVQNLSVNKNNYVTVKWSESEGQDQYYVYKKVDGGKYSRIGKTTGTSYTDKTCSAGVKYVYTVRAAVYDDTDGWLLSKYKGSDMVVTKPAMPTISKIKVGTDHTIALNWSKSSGAEKYYVYRKTEKGKYSRIAECKGTSYTDKTCSVDEKYIYTVRACIYNTSTKKWILSDYKDSAVVKAQ